MILTNEVPGRNRDRIRKHGKIKVSYDAIAKMLDLPKDCSIVAVYDNIDNYISLKVINENIKEIAEGSPVTELLPGQGGWKSP